MGIEKYRRANAAPGSRDTEGGKDTSGNESFGCSQSHDAWEPMMFLRTAMALHDVHILSK